MHEVKLLKSTGAILRSPDCLTYENLSGVSKVEELLKLMWVDGFQRDVCDSIGRHGAVHKNAGEISAVRAQHAPVPVEGLRQETS